MAAEQFRPWRRPGMTSLADAASFEAGRLVAGLPVSLSSGSAQRTLTAKFALSGPGDVRGLAGGAVRVRAPSPGSTRAESTTVAFVELGDPDLPWRYTPHVNPAAGSPGLRPWLVLVVGETGSEVAVHGDHVQIAGTLLGRHDLSRSAAWAHVHELPDGGAVGRILSPVALLEDTHYTAVLVPAFRIDGAVPVSSWTGIPGDLDLRCYDSWGFRTKVDPDDFKTIAQRLAPLSDAELADLEDKEFGVARVAAGPAGRQQLVLGGALTRRTPPPVNALRGPVAKKVSDRARLPWRSGSPWVLGLPRYDDPWTTAPGTEPRPSQLSGWRAQLHQDPRHRGVAGLGGWAAIAWQDRIASGAKAQAGAIATAAERIRHLGMGLRAVRGLWDRRVPDDPVAALAVLSPMLGRLPTAGGTVLDELDHRTPSLVPALFSSAAKRLLRPRGPVARAAQDGATGLGTLIGLAATTCPPTAPPPPGQEGVSDALAADPDGIVSQFSDFPSDLLHQAFQAITQSDQEHGGHSGEPPDGRLGEGLGGSVSEGASEIVDLLVGSRPHVECRPVVIDEAAVSIVDGVNPHLNPVVVDRVLAPFTGLREPRLAPPDLALELDIPFWSYLRDQAPDWLLPGAADVPDDRVLALATNPAFVDAFLLGANQQALGELRRRNIPVIAGWTPLRRFWQRISDDGSKPSDLDVVSVLDPSLAPNWQEGSPLGHSSHQRGTSGPMLVLLLSTELFREYPHTQVYLAPVVAEATRWTTLPDVTDGAVRVDPVLTGTLDPELVFFGFPLPPAAISDHWLVLEEPAPGYRFRSPTTIEAEMTDGAQYAHDTLYEPVRAFFGNLL